jgi:8-oxo-dGTP pyrophosphatase MutT (NUDIX family)
VKDNKFHLIARAVILDKNRILLARQKGMSNTFLPGGHIETGESAVTALQREIREELGLSLKVESFLGCVEAGWEDEKRHNFEVNLIFRAGLQNQNSDISPESCEEHLEFLWSAVDDLDKNNLRPLPLRKMISGYAAGDSATWWGSTLQLS